MSHGFDHCDYIVHNMKECFRIPAYVFNKSGSLICPSIEKSAHTIFFYQNIVNKYLAGLNTDSTLLPQVLVLTDNIYFLIFPAKEEQYLILGPVGSNYLTAQQSEDFRKTYHLEDVKPHLVKLPISQLMSMCSIVWFMLTGNPIETHQIRVQKDFMFELSESDSTEYRLFSYKEDKPQNTFVGEQIWCNYIETGDIQKMNDMISHSQNLYSSFNSVGTLAKNNDYKQIEYTLVTSISLAMHAAIRGGVPPFNCYEASDLLLQKAAVCTDIFQLYDLFIETFETFTMLVYMRRQNQRYSLLIDKCKDYIVKHLYRPFKISDMSAELHINNNYLSQLFSKETGMTIQHYIRNERLSAAANLLKFSEESVGQISDYMQFSSPSRFSGYFKEKYNMTPLEYRTKYKIAEFKE